MSLPTSRQLVVKLPEATQAANRCRYVLDWLVTHPYAEGRLSWKISTGDAPGLDLEALTKSSNWLTEQREKPSLTVVTCSTPEGMVFGIGNQTNEAFFKDNHWGFDWVATLFFWLSRWEEQYPFRENPTPMPAADQWFVHHNLARVPQADRLALAILKALNVETSFGESRVHLSHDLDHVRLFQQPWMGLRYGLSLMKSGGPISQLTIPLADQLKVALRSKPDPYNNAVQTLQSTGGTLFLLLGRHVSQDGGSDKTNSRLREWIDTARAKGYEIGLHPSFTTAQNPERMLAEIERFVTLTGARPTLSRQHFLRWDWQKTPQALESEGLIADSTLGYRERLGFRCGTSFPYRLYDFSKEAASSLIEWPMVAMENAWMLANDQDPERCAEDWRSFVQQNKRGADLMINIHNSGYYHAQLKGIDLSAWNKWIQNQPQATWSEHFSRLSAV